jgi:phenylpropionate dioxygenase-like ring-hydroxylating dioxygenase large terminal subunit
MNEPQLAQRPGEARCPGPSTRELILADPFAPPALLAESPVFLGDEDVPFTNYTSVEHAAAERLHLWSRTWQWVCREEHIPKAGDYQVYDIGDLSAIVIRQPDGTLKAFHNFCLHRGTQLKPSVTTPGRAKVLRCPFHGWTWSLEGQLVDLPCRWDFPHVDDEEFSLPEIQVGTWGGFVFVNFDPAAPSLVDYMGVLPEHFATWRVQDRYVQAHVRKRLPANWKAAAEAFLEAYHVLETHSQAIMATGDANAQYDVFGDHVSRFIHTVGTPSPHLDPQPTEQQVLDFLFARRYPKAEDRPTLPAGNRARDVLAAHVQRDLGERFGQDFSHLSVSETIDSIEYFLFPNQFFFPGLDKSMCYRFRPDGDDPNRCIFDLIILRPNPLDGPAPRPPVPTELSVEDSYTLCNELDRGLAMVYDQDTANMAAQTRGFKGSSKRGQTLGNYQEVRARHLHTMVGRYLDGTV